MAKREKTVKVATSLGELVFFNDDAGEIKVQLSGAGNKGIVAVIPKKEIGKIVDYLKEFK